MRLVLTCFICCGLIASASAQLSEVKESMTPGREISRATTLIYRYMQSHNQALPQNWSDIWDARDVAWAYRYLQGQPMVHRQVAFVDSASQLTADGSGTRIIAITRNVVPRPFGKDKEGNPEWIDHRLITFMTKDGKLRQGSVDADKPMRGTNLDQLVLKDADLTDKQVADTVAAMVEFGFYGNHIREAFGDEAIDAVQKSGLLNVASQKELNATVQLASTPTIAATTPQPSTTSTAPVEVKQPPSSFPVVPVAILAAAIVGAAVFFVLRRKSI